MVSTWLSQISRSVSAYPTFSLFDVLEKFELSPHCNGAASSKDADMIKSILVDSIIKSRFDPAFLEDLARDLGWDNVRKQLIVPLLPDNDNARGMEFGEVLTEEVMKVFYDYDIPIPKRRYSITRGQTLPGNDSLAVKVANNEIVEVCFVESKLRNVRDYQAGTDAYEELKKKYSEELPAIINFNLRRMAEINHELLSSFKEYLKDRTDKPDKDAFCIGLTYDSSRWTEKVLEHVHDAIEGDKSNNLALPPMKIIAIRIKDLKSIVDHIFEIAVNRHV